MGSSGKDFADSEKAPTEPLVTGQRHLRTTGLALLQFCKTQITRVTAPRRVPFSGQEKLAAPE